MGFGLIIILATLFAAYFVGRQLGWQNIFTTLLNPSKARFTRRDAQDGATIFEVVPARASWIVLAVFLTGLWLMWTSFQMSDSRWLVLAFSLIPLLMALLTLPIGARHRKPARLTLTNDALSDGARSWRLAEIAQITARKGSRRGEEEIGSFVTTVPGEGVVYGGKPTTSLLMKAFGGRMAERSYQLLLRTRAGSKEEVLSGGLTLECAQALVNDLNQALRDKHVS